MRFYTILLFQAVILFMLFTATTGLCSETEKEGLRLPAVVVTARAENDPTYQTGDVDTSVTPAFYTIIRREQFEGKMEGLAEVLEKEAAVQIRKSGGLGSFSTVSLRGSSSDQVMVFLDGILLNDASMGGVDLSNISLSDVESVEIFKGITPLNFGKSSIGGVVNIRTLRSQKLFNASLTTGYGSFDTFNFHGFVNHKPGKWDYLASADYMGSDNDFWILNNNGTNFNDYDDEWQKRHNNQIFQGDFMLKAGCDISEDLRLDFSNQFFSKDQQLPGWNNLETTRTTFDTRRNTSVLKITADNLGRFNMSGYIDTVWKKESYKDVYGDIGLGSQYNEYFTKSYGGHYYVEHVSGANTLTGILDARLEYYEPEDLIYTERTPKDSKRATLCAGLQDTLFLFDDTLSVTPGVRYTFISDELYSAMSSAGFPLPREKEDKNYFSPQIGIKYLFAKGVTLKSNLAKYTREPSFFELFGDRGFFLGNHELRAEKGVNFDIGVEFTRIIDSPVVRRISWHTALFRSDIEDVITFTYDARGVGKAINITGADIRGVETEFKMDFLKWFRIIGNATWQDTKNLDPDVSFYGKHLSGRAAKSFMGRLEGRYKGIKVYFERLLEDGMFYDTANLLPAKEKKVSNIGATWLYKSMMFTFEGNNLEKNRHQDFNGYLKPGVSYTLSIKYHFE